MVLPGLEEQTFPVDPGLEEQTLAVLAELEEQTLAVLPGLEEQKLAGRVERSVQICPGLADQTLAGLGARLTPIHPGLGDQTLVTPSPAASSASVSYSVPTAARAFRLVAAVPLLPPQKARQKELDLQAAPSPERTRQTPRTCTSGVSLFWLAYNDRLF